jgi:hypothetical protein
MTVGPTTPTPPAPSPGGSYGNYLPGVGGVSSNLGLSTSKNVFGTLMTKTRAKQFFMDAQQSGDYSLITSLLSQKGYLTGKGNNVKTVESNWNTFLDVVYQSDVTNISDFTGIGETGTGAGTTSAVYKSLTGKISGTELINTLFTDYIGVLPGVKEIKTILTALDTLEQKRATRQVTSRDASGNIVQTTTGGVTDQDRENLILGFIGKRIPAEGIENIGGAIGNNLASIRKFANEHGIVLPDTDIRKMALNSVLSKTGLDDTAVKIRNIAKSRYPSLIPYIDAGLSVKEIGSQYMARKAQLLEIPLESLNVFDLDVNKVLSGQSLMAMSDYDTIIRQNPLYKFTMQAREKASEFATNILKDFGLMK